MARKLIEQFRRNEGIDLTHSTQVRLADGQEWYIPMPVIELQSEFNDGDCTGSHFLLTCGEELDGLLRGITKVETRKEQIEAVFLLGGKLLRRNYSDLSDEELQQLFRYRYGESESDEMVDRIISAATGKLYDVAGWDAVDDPKAPAVGCV